MKKHETTILNALLDQYERSCKCQQKDSDIWKNEIASKKSDVIKLANETNTHHLFDWLRAAQIKDNREYISYASSSNICAY